MIAVERRGPMTAQPFRRDASSPIDQCSDIAPRTSRTLTMLNLAPSSVFLQLLAWRDGYRFTCFASRAGLDRLQLVSARHRRP